jgi:hypothetical protein
MVSPLGLNFQGAKSDDQLDNYATIIPEKE